VIVTKVRPPASMFELSAYGSASTKLLRSDRTRECKTTLVPAQSGTTITLTRLLVYVDAGVLQFADLRKFDCQLSI